MTFEATLTASRLGDPEALSVMIEQYYPLITKKAVVNDVYDEDLEQELIATLMNCVRCFDPKKYF